MSSLVSNGTSTVTATTPATQAIADALMGPPFMGWMLNIGAFGLVLARFFDYTYPRLYAEDPWHTKAVLWTVMALCTTSIGVSVGQAYSLAMGVPPLDSVPPALAGLLAMIVQLFLVHRSAKLLRDRRWLRVFLLVGVGSMSVVAFGFSIAVSVLYATGSANTESVVFTQALFSQFHTVDMCDGIWLWLSAAVDISISVSLYLVIRKLIAGLNPSTDTTIVSLIRLSVETASYTSLVAIGGALMSVVFPENRLSAANILYAFTFPLPSLYTLSLLVTLNGRSRNPDGSISWKHSGDVPTGRNRNTTHTHTHTATNRAEIFVLHDVAVRTDMEGDRPWEARNSERVLSEKGWKERPHESSDVL